jgi:hypothetical protein
MEPLSLKDKVALVTGGEFSTAVEARKEAKRMIDLEE